jgi:hypothetical protein
VRLCYVAHVYIYVHICMCIKYTSLYESHCTSTYRERERERERERVYFEAEECWVRNLSNFQRNNSPLFTLRCSYLCCSSGLWYIYTWSTESSEYYIACKYQAKSCKMQSGSFGGTVVASPWTFCIEYVCKVKVRLPRL